MFTKDLSPDDIMRLYPRMIACVTPLIEACKNTKEGRQAIRLWDKYRGNPPDSSEDEMTTEWKPLPTMQDVAKAQADGWEIERHYIDGGWLPWEGKAWQCDSRYRGRPRQPAMKKVKLEAWLSEYELRWLNVEAGNKPAPHWVRVPSEDKEIEVKDDN